MDWTKSLKTTFPQFLKAVTLHDSYWVGMFINEYNEVVLVIKLDAFWNQAYTLKTSNTDYWPFLLIRINKVVNISFDSVDQDMVISTAESRVISSLEIEKLIDCFSKSVLLSKHLNCLLDCKQLHKTSIYNLPGVTVELLHDGEIELLLLEEDGQYIDPSLEKAKPFESSPEEKTENKTIMNQIWNKIKKD